MKKAIKVLLYLFLAAGLALLAGCPTESDDGGGGGGDKVSNWNGTVDKTWYTGTGPFTIKTAAQLAGLAELVNGGNEFAGKTITQTIDIDLKGKEWTPIGSDTKEFKGAYDGKGKTISGLKITIAASYQGLFGWIGTGGKVSNVKLKDVSVKGGNYVGGVTGRNDGTVEKCSITDSSVEGSGDFIGGVAGRNDGTVENCSVTGGSVKGGEEVGGVVGYIEGGTGTVKNCFVSGSSVEGIDAIGGVVGFNFGGTVKNCVAMNKEIKSTGLIARVVASYDSGYLMYNYADSAMKLNGSTVTGGLAINEGGEDITSAEWNNAMWWEETAQFDPTVWILTDGNLPALQ